MLRNRRAFLYLNWFPHEPQFRNFYPILYVLTQKGIYPSTNTTIYTNVRSDIYLNGKLQQLGFDFF